MTTAQESNGQELACIVSQLAPRLEPTPTNGDQDPNLDRTTVRTALEFFAEPAVAAAVLAETRTGHDHTDAVLGVFTESVSRWHRGHWVGN